MGWQRQLQQDAVYAVIFIEAVDQPGQVLLAGVGRQVMGNRGESDLFAVLALVGYIDFGGRIIAYQDDSQTGSATAGSNMGADGGSNVLTNRSGNGFAINELCGHKQKHSLYKQKGGVFSHAAGLQQSR